MLLRALSLAALLGLSVAPAQAACALVVVNGGTLVLAGNNTDLSTEGSGSPATFTVVNTDIFGATVTVTAPQWVQWPAGFNTGTAQNQIAYFGVGLLGSVSRSYTSSQSSFAVPGLLSLATLVTVNNKISNATGFQQGTYTTRTTITCS
jgi:hypothetical protein